MKWKNLQTKIKARFEDREDEEGVSLLSKKEMTLEMGLT